MKQALLAAVVVLALVTGVLHLSLEFVLFHGLAAALPGGSAGAPPGPPAGAPPPPGGPSFPFGLQLPQLFLGNFLVYLVLAILVVAVSRVRAEVRALIDVLIVVMTVLTLAGWNSIGRPDPNNLGTVALVVEAALIVCAIVHALTLRDQAPRPDPAAA